MIIRLRKKERKKVSICDHKVQKRILGIDYGTRRIGIAVSDPLGIIAQGVCVVANSGHMIEKIKQLVQEYEPELIVVGFPLNLKGEKGQKAIEVDEFIMTLERELPLVVVRWDERFTSVVAHQTILRMNVKKKNRREKENIDVMAAALILQSYLDNRQKTPLLR